MLNSDRYLEAFNLIERRLRKITNSEKGTTFFSLVNAAAIENSFVRHSTDDLKEFGDLRNAIVHERTDGHVIAEPNARTLKKIEYIKSILYDPPKVIPMFKTKVLSFSVKDSIAAVVSILVENSFSQFVIYDGTEFIGLLTSNTIARWLGSCVDGDDILIAEETPISVVLEYTEIPNSYSFIKRKATIFDALEIFYDLEKKGKSCDAVLITESGKPNEHLLGIITVWDIPKIYRKIGI